MMYMLSRMAGSPGTKNSIDMTLSTLQYSACGRLTSMNIRMFAKQSRAMQEKKQDRPKLVEKKVSFEPSWAIRKDNGLWYLPAGTRVKHGTTTNNLRSILEKGLLKGDQALGRSKYRGAYEPNPKIPQGVYVASCHLAYFASVFNFESACKEQRRRRFPSALYTFLQYLFSASRERRLKVGQDFAEKSLVNVDDNVLGNYGLPSVLNIILQEDVIIRADETFLDKSCKAEESALTNAASFVWDQFGSCVLLVEKVPANWIKSVELVEADYRDAFWELMLYLVSENPILEIAQSAVRRNMIDAKRQLDENKMNSKMRISQDIKNLRFSKSLCEKHLVEARKLWHKKVTQQLGRSAVYSRVVSPENVFSVLDELEKDERRFLATCFSLYEAL
jgi:hypothetical protein